MESQKFSVSNPLNALTTKDIRLSLER